MDTVQHVVQHAGDNSVGSDRWKDFSPIGGSWNTFTPAAQEITKKYILEWAFTSKTENDVYTFNISSFKSLFLLFFDDNGLHNNRANTKIYVLYSICTFNLVGAPFPSIPTSKWRDVEAVSLWHCQDCFINAPLSKALSLGLGKATFLANLGQ